MSCKTCQTKFSLFTRDVGCPSCGFSYCNKCLKYKYDIPNIGVKKICGCCYNKFINNAMKKLSPETTMNNISMSNISKEPLAPVDIAMKLDLLENPGKPPVVIYKHINHWDKLKKGLESVDQQIVDRLQKLKDKKHDIPSVEEIKQRLALLKDQDLEANGNSNVINVHQVNTRTDQQKTDDLIQEYIAQLELSSTNDPCTEIQQRLNSLRNEHFNHDKEEKIEDDEITTKKIIDKVLAEVKLETKYEFVKDIKTIDSEISHESEDEDEKPTCVMCERTAHLVQCTGCSKDLYCPKCFDDNHDDFEMGKHKAIPIDEDKL